MFIYKTTKDILNLDLILSSGQVFRYEILEDKFKILYHKNQALVFEEREQGILIHGTEEQFENMWVDYFDLKRDYQSLNQKIIEKDDMLAGLISEYAGLRILQQDPFEMIITFITSQSKSIPQIKKLMNDLAESYGDSVEILGGTYHLFPRWDQLEQVREEDFRKMKFGYRAPYLVDAISKVASGELDLEALKDTDNETLKHGLKSILGVGDKVASCVMLFAYGRHNMFPVDTWIKKAMVRRYFNEHTNVTNKEIEDLGLSMFGEASGIAQQYIFEFERRMK